MWVFRLFVCAYVRLNIKTALDGFLPSEAHALMSCDRTAIGTHDIPDFAALKDKIKDGNNGSSMSRLLFKFISQNVTWLLF